VNKGKTIFAKIIRIISIPPIMIIALILLLYFLRPDIFRNASEAIILILLLGGMPILAYPTQKIIPPLRKKGRDCQRKLAFIFTLIGYAAALVWSIVVLLSDELLQVCLTYFMSVFILTFINKVLKTKASGHACSVFGPLIFTVYLIDWRFIFLNIVIAIIIFWSSLYLKRHTKKELFLGALSNLIAFALSCLPFLLFIK